MKKNKRKKSLLRRFCRMIITVNISLIMFITIVNAYVCISVSRQMRSVEDSLSASGYDCIIVLGCGVWGSTPTPLLSDRLDAAIELYRNGVAPKILMSGDHGQKNYDEVTVMRNYALSHDVASEDIFLDHAGFSTYETMYRAAEVFGVRKAMVVTQKYHLYRALYDARALGIEADGAIATGHVFMSQLYWDLREAAARVKDFLWCIFKPLPTYLGGKIDITGNGEVTLD
ncbi:MAG: YdcF family protein [Erysipelotrichaceae bacterium]|nr:YdcF family protein [Erysipelotrichaceae bacterium]